MKIVNTKQYIEIKLYNEEKNTTLNEDFEYVFAKDHSLDTELDKLKINNSQLQVFYEMIQNAEDAKASDLWFHLTDTHLFILNNGAKFSYNPRKSKEEKISGELYSFLSTNVSNKGEDKSNLGQKGFGSKTLYNLLGNIDVNFGFKDAVCEGAGIYFLSGERKQLIEFRRVTSLTQFQPQDVSKLNQLLFFKICDLFYPAIPMTAKKPDSTAIQETILFPEKEVLEVIKQIDSFFRIGVTSERIEKDFNLLVVPLGQGQYDFIHEREKEFSSSIESLLGRLKNLKRIYINGKVITNKEWLTQTFKLSDDTQTEVAVIFPRKPTLSLKLINIHQTLPLLREKHKIGFILDFPQSLITPDMYRQSLDNSAKSKLHFKNMLEGVKQVLIKLVDEGELDQFRALYLAAICYKANESCEWSDVYETFREEIKQIILTDDGILASDLTKVFYRVSPLAATPAVLKIQDKYYVDREIQDFIKSNYKILEQENALPNIQDLPISNLINEASTGALHDWLCKISEGDYIKVIGLLAQEENFKINPCQPSIRINNGSVLSIDEIKHRHDIGVNFEGGEKFIALYDQHKWGYNLIPLEKSIFRTHPEIDSKFFYNRIINLFKEKVESMERPQRYQLNEAFRFALYKHEYFKIYEHEVELLYDNGSKLKTLATIPDFEHTFLSLLGIQLMPSEHKIGQGTLKKQDLWTTLINDWAQIKPLLQMIIRSYSTDKRADLIQDFYSWMHELYESSTDFKKLNYLNNLDIYPDTEGKFYPALNYVSSSISNKEEYAILSKYLHHVGIYLAPIQLKGIFSKEPFKVKQLNIDNLFLNATARQTSIEEFKVLMREFKDFVTRIRITESTNGFSIQKNSSDEVNCFYKGSSEVTKCLIQASNINLIPEQAFNLQNADLKSKLLLVNNSEAKHRLLSNSQFSRDLIDFVISEIPSDDFKSIQSYIKCLGQISLAPGQTYSKVSFEKKIFEFIESKSGIVDFDILRKRILIGNKPLIDLKFSNPSVSVGCSTFDLKDFDYATDDVHNNLLVQFSSGVQDKIFKKKLETSDSVFKKFKDRGKLTGIQLGFLIAYATHHHLEKHQHSETLLQHDQLNAFLDWMYEHKNDWSKFREYFSFQEKDRYFTDIEEHLILSEESITSSQYFSWSGMDNQKLNFLCEVGIGKTDKSEIELRKIFLANSKFDDCKKLSQKNTANFLKWLLKESILFKKEGVKFVNDTIEDYTKKNSINIFIVSSLQLDSYCIEEVKDNERVALLSDSDLDVFHKIKTQYPYIWIKDNIKSTPYGNRLNICSLEIVRKTSLSYSKSEWNSGKYQEWQSKLPKSNWKIFIIKADQFQVDRLLLEDKEEKFDIDKEEVNFVWHDRNSPKELYVGSKSGKTSEILSFLEKNKNEIFTNKEDALVYTSLLESFMPDSKAIEFLEKNIASDILIELQKRDDLANVLDALREDKIGGKGDDEKKKKSKINKFNGLVGEFLLIEFLKKKGLEVYHEDKSEYDIRYVTEKSNHYVEVKTQADSLGGDRIDFHFGKKQINKVKTIEGGETMEIVHISLSDLDIYDKVLSIKHQQLSEAEIREYLLSIAKTFFEDSSNIELFKNRIISLRLNSSIFN